ncbi:MAG: RluA family pseudouridine synthase [Roseibacillus sp.]
MRITVSQDPGERLDLFLTRELSELSRSRIQSLLKSGHILLNGAQARPKTSVSSGDEITIELPEPEPSSLIPQDIPLNIIHEDEDLIVINKPVGLVVHPAAGNPDGTLVNALLHHCRGNLPGASGVERPGIVHRLDKDTSGCIVAAKSDLAQKSLLQQFADRETTKLYLATTHRCPIQPSGSIFTHLGRHPVNRQKQAVLTPGSGRPAITDYYVLRKDEERQCGLVLCHLHTGRTHQIRVHLQHLGCPILGDPVYGNPNRQSVDTGRLMLHAWRLGFTHPGTARHITFEAPIPDEFAPFLPDEALLTRIRDTAPDALKETLAIDH